MENIIEELKWRGLYADMTPGTEEQLLKEPTKVYIGFDPTADSLHVGSLVPIILLKHLENYGHNPIALIGGATGMIGDPTGKSDERNLLDEEALQKNILGIKNVLSRYLDIDGKTKLVNNYDWMKDFSFLSFIRDVGKKITVNYMMSKDSVKKRLDGNGMSFTEFTYQLLQGYDFYHLNKEMDCKIQMGGSDQWGNMTTGIELTKKISGNSVNALTCPLTTKSDGTKFGKSEGGNIWLDADKTSVYKFYQFWLNSTDVDAEKYIKIYTFLGKEEIYEAIRKHRENPGKRELQQLLAKELTCFVHSEEDYNKAVKASEVVFNGGDLESVDESTLIEIFNDLPKVTISRNSLETDIDIISLMNETTGFIKSNNEVRRAIKENSLSLNRSKINDEKMIVNKSNLIKNRFMLLQRGKKNHMFVMVV